jgi:hypothetical protein
MEINAQTVPTLLDQGGVLYTKRVDPGATTYRVIDGFGKVPKDLSIVVYETGTVLLDKGIALRDFIERLS